MKDKTDKIWNKKRSKIQIRTNTTEHVTESTALIWAFSKNGEMNRNEEKRQNIQSKIGKKKKRNQRKHGPKEYKTTFF